MGNIVVGNTIEVKWPENGEWYAGRVSAYDAENDQHTIEYTNSEIEHVTLYGDCSNGIVWRAQTNRKNKTRR